MIKYLKSRVRANCSAASFLFFGIKPKFCSANTRTSCQGVFVPSLCRKCLIAVEERSDDDVIFTIETNFIFIFTFRGILFIALPVVRIKSGVQILKIPAYQKIRPTKWYRGITFKRNHIIRFIYYMIHSISSIRYGPYDMVHDIWRYHIGHFIWPIWYGSYHASQTIWAISYGSYHLLDYWFLAFVKPSNFFPSFFRFRTSFNDQQNITFTSNVWSFQWNKNIRS